MRDDEHFIAGCVAAALAFVLCVCSFVQCFAAEPDGVLSEPPANDSGFTEVVDSEPVEGGDVSEPDLQDGSEPLSDDTPADTAESDVGDSDISEPAVGEDGLPPESSELAPPESSEAPPSAPPPAVGGALPSGEQGSDVVVTDGDGNPIGGDGTDEDGELLGDVVINAGSVIVMSIPEDNEYPPGSPLAGGLYMDATTSQLGKVLIYVPIDYQRGSFTYDGSGNVVNLRAGTITGFMYRGSTLYNVYWPALQTAQYRQYNAGGGYSGLTVRSVDNTNVIFIESNEDIPLVPNSEVYQLVAIMLLGGITLCLFMKRF